MNAAAFHSSRPVLTAFARISQSLTSLEQCGTACIDPIHKWLPIKNYFVNIKISPTNLVFELIIHKSSYSQTRSVKGIQKNLNCQPFIDRLFGYIN